MDFVYQQSLIPFDIDTCPHTLEKLGSHFRDQVVRLLIKPKLDACTQTDQEKNEKKPKLQIKTRKYTPSILEQSDTDSGEEIH